MRLHALHAKYLRSINNIYAYHVVKCACLGPPDISDALLHDSSTGEAQRKLRKTHREAEEEAEDQDRFTREEEEAEEEETDGNKKTKRRGKGRGKGKKPKEEKTGEHEEPKKGRGTKGVKDPVARNLDAELQEASKTEKPEPKAKLSAKRRARKEDKGDDDKEDDEKAKALVQQAKRRKVERTPPDQEDQKEGGKENVRSKKATPKKRPRSKAERSTPEKAQQEDRELKTPVDTKKGTDPDKAARARMKVTPRTKGKRMQALKVGMHIHVGNVVQKLS